MLLLLYHMKVTESLENGYRENGYSLFIIVGSSMTVCSCSSANGASVQTSAARKTDSPRRPHQQVPFTLSRMERDRCQAAPEATSNRLPISYHTKVTNRLQTGYNQVNNFLEIPRSHRFSSPPRRTDTTLSQRRAQGVYAIMGAGL